MAKTPKKISGPESQVYSQYEALQELGKEIGNLDALFDKIAVENDLSFATMDASQKLKGNISTGILSADLITNGGYGAGRMCYVYGPTGAGKSTFTYHGLLSAINRDTRCVFFDHEVCSDPDYLENIGINLLEVSGLRGKDGKWKKSPLYRYTEATIAEDTFKAIHHILKALPYKIEMFDSSSKENRYFLIDPAFDTRKTWANINEGLKQKKIVETEDFAPQMFFVIDSLKAMIPEGKWNDPSSNPMAILARCLQEFFPLIKGVLSKKHCTLLTTNHVTINPAQRYGSPETEPGGQAVNFYPDLKMRARTQMTEKAILSEPTISGIGEDRYRPGTIKVMKNKGGSSYRSVEYRIWLDSAGKPGMGIDPVFDTYQYLEMTEQLGFTNKKNTEFKILVPGFDSEPLNWAKLKRLVLTEPKLHEACAKQITDGIAQSRYYDWLSKPAATTKKKDKDKEEDGSAGGIEEDDSVSPEEIEELLSNDSLTEVTV